MSTDNNENVEYSKINLPPKASNGFIFTLKEISRKQYRCRCISWDLNKGKKKHDCVYAPCPVIGWQFEAVIIVINIIVSEEANPWRVEDGDVKLVDEDGFVYKGRVLCNNLSSNDNQPQDGEYIDKRTQADLIYAFSPIPDGKAINRVNIYVDYDHVLSFVINENHNRDDVFSSDYYLKIAGNNESRAEKSEMDKVRYDSLTHRLDFLKENIFKRFNTTLTTNGARALEDKIRVEIYSINLNIQRHKLDPDYTPIIDEFSNIVNEYQKLLENIHAHNLSSPPESLEELMDMDPFRFEYFCANLLKKLGYKDVNVTPRSNDKGIDIIATKMGRKCAVQCKRYKNSVGSPEIQSFIGALVNSGAEKGIFITTGSFTTEAELMARQNDIDLIDGELLASYLES